MNAALHALPALMARAISAHRLLQPGERVLVGLSGGADSVALVAGLTELGYTVEAAHCNFHLRGAESDRDEAFCRELCAGLGVDMEVAHFDTAAEARRAGESVEMAARRLRYAWFARLCSVHDLRRVAVAHHAGDNVETLLLSLVRGAGLHGLTGMKPLAGHVVRPMLEATRADVTAYLAARSLPHVDDSSNADTRLKRNLVRHELLPLLRRLNPSVDVTLRATMERLADAEALYALGLETAEAAVERRGDTFSVPLGAACPPRAAVYEWLTAAGFTPDVVARVCAQQPPRTGALFESPTHQAVVHDGQLEVCPRPAPLSPTALPGEGCIALPDGGRLRVESLPRSALGTLRCAPSVALLDADAVRLPLTLRRAGRADRFAPFGMQGTKLVSDFLTDRHLSRLARMAALVVTDAEGIVWLVGHRPDRRCAVTAATSRVVRLTLVPAGTP